MTSIKKTSRTFGILKHKLFVLATVLFALYVLDVANAQPPMPGGFPNFQGAPQEDGRPDRNDRRNRGDRRRGDDQQNDKKDDKQNDKQGGEKKEERKEQEKQVQLDQALQSANSVTPIRLNQNEFTASDGTKLTGTYYKGKGDTDTPVVILLNDINGSKEALEQLALLLAQNGNAVLIPDLRGQNGSGAQARGAGDNNPPNDRKQIKEGVSPYDIRAMIQADRSVWFNFLLYLHNNEYCNMKKTILVGGGFGAALAASWAKSDWNTKGDYGQNVVGLALLSPDASSDDGKYDALTSLEAVHKKAKGAVMGYVIITGKMNEDKLEDAKKIQQKLGGKNDAEAAPEAKVCPIAAIETEQQSVELLRYEAFGAPTTILQFVAQRMQKLPKKRNKWEEIGEKSSRR